MNRFVECKHEWASADNDEVFGMEICLSGDLKRLNEGPVPKKDAWDEILGGVTVVTTYKDSKGRVWERQEEALRSQENINLRDFTKLMLRSVHNEGDEKDVSNFLVSNKEHLYKILTAYQRPKRPDQE